MPPRSKTSTWTRATRRAVKAAPGGAGGYSYGGGPLYSDAYRARRGPTSSELVEAYKSLIYFLMRTNSMAVACVPLRLYVTTGDRQDRAKCFRKPVTRERKAWLRAQPHLSKMLAGADEIEEVTDHPILQALHDQNPFMDFHQWLIYTVEQMDLIGTAYTLPEFGNVGRAKVPTGHWALPAHLVYPVPDGTTLVPKGYQYFSTLYTPQELIRFRFIGHRNPYMDGMSPARAAISYARLEDEFVAVQDAVLSNGPRPSVIVSPKDPSGVIGKPERERFRNDFAAVGRGGRQGGAIFADGAVDVKPITWSPADIGAKILSEYDVERTANCFGVPGPFYSKETNLANMEAARSLHAEMAVEPRCRAIANTLTRFYREVDATNRLGWDRLFLAFDPASREDEEKESKIIDMNLKNGRLTINQANADSGLPAVPWGDEPWLPQTLIQPSEKAAAVQRASAMAANLTPAGATAEPDAEAEPEAAPLEGKKGHPFGVTRKESPDRGTEFGGEKGESLRDEIIKWFHRQYEEVLGIIPDIGAPLPDSFPSLADYDDPMASAMVPILSTYWDRGGKTTLARLGLDAEDWNVRRPELVGKIRDAAFAFCQSTNESTSKRLDVALEELRGALTDGGGSLPSLTKKVNDIFEGLTKSHAEMIAASESSRALHAAQVEASRQSGVVAGFELLLSSDACPLCRAIYDSCPRVRVGDAFAVIGDHPIYATIQHPPLHPSCACSLTSVIIPSMGGPSDPTWYETLKQPQEAVREGLKPVARVKPGVAPPIPVKPPQPQPVAPIEPPKPKPEPEVFGATPAIRDARRQQIAANGGERIKDGPIEDRIKAYAVGDAKVAEIARVGGEIEAEIQVQRNMFVSLGIEGDKLEAQKVAILEVYGTVAPDQMPVHTLKFIENIEDQQADIRKQRIAAMDKIQAIREASRDQIKNLISAQDKAAFTHEDVPKGFKDGKPFAALKGEIVDRFTKAQEWLSGVTAKGQTDRVHVQAGQRKSHRAYYNYGKKLITVKTDEPTDVVVHEYGHAIEHQLNGVILRANEFLNYRVAGEKPSSMAKFGLKGEYGRKDKFDRVFSERSAYYVGKDYGGGITEIVSMGVQQLYNDPVKFANNDPEYCKFILGILDGSLR